MALPKNKDIKSLHEIKQRQILSKLTSMYKNRFISSALAAGGSFYLMRYYFDYYKDPLPIHVSWVTLQLTLGTGLSAACFLLNRGRGGNVLKIIGR
jgi:hypothetical protein